MGDICKEKLERLFSALRADKKTFMIVAVGLIGIIMIFASEIPTFDSEGTDSHISDSESVYGEKEELENIIGKISGVGRVTVMLTYAGTAESVYASNFSEQKDDTKNKTEEELLILDKGNTEDGLLIKEIYPAVTGIAVVCEGGGNPTVKNEITQMLKALYDISSNNISISEMKG